MTNLKVQGKQSQRKIYEQKYKNARMNLLLVVVFTLINLFLLVTNSSTYFLFSAFVPYYITGIGMLLCGRFPDEFYIDELEGMTVFGNSVFVVLVVISVVITLLYFLAWFMSSKNRVGWLIFALSFFGVDTLAMLLLNGISFETLVDIAFHAWVIYYLTLGICVHYKLKKLPSEEEIVYQDKNISQPIELGQQNSYIIREASKDVKHRILLETRMFNYDICYRRVKRTNELVINGNVYDEIEGLVENPHTLKALIDGHCIEVRFTGTHSIISFDNEDIAKKLRLF